MWGGYSQETVTDDLTWSNLDLKSSYSSFTNKKSKSDAVYCGCAMKGSNGGGCIQLNKDTKGTATKPNQLQGIVTTASGGKIKSIKVDFAQTANKNLTIYGKNSAYSGSDDLITANKGTKIATINKSQTINVEGEYKYVGIYSNGGANYISKITIVWEKESSKTPTTTTFVDDVDGKTVIVYKGGSFPAYKATATDKSGQPVEGTYKYTSSNTVCVTVDGTTGQTAAGTEFGKADIKVDFTPTDAAYEGSSASYTIDYKDIIPMLTFSKSSVTVTKGLETGFKEPTVTLNDGLGNNVDLTDQRISYGAEPEGIVDVDTSTGKITNWIKPGTTTIKAIVDGGKYDRVSGEYTIDYKKADTAIEFVEGETSVNINNSIAVKAVLKANGVELSDVKPTYTSSSNKIATIDEDGNVTGVAAGKVTITASFTGNDYYNGATSATYDVIVIDPNIVFYESFDKCDGAGGQNSFKTSGSGDPIYDIAGWTGTYVYKAERCIKIGNKNGSGSATTPALNYKGDAILTFKAALYNKDNTNLTLSIKGGGTLDKTSLTMVEGKYVGFTVNIKGCTSATKITFSPEKRCFLDEVKVTATKSEQAESVTLTEGNNEDVITTAASAGKPCNVTLERSMIADGGWYTFCVPFDIENIATTPLKDAEIRKYKSMTGSIMNFEPTTSLKAMHAYLVKPKSDVVNPVFEDVLVVSEGDNVIDGENGYKFVGIRSKQPLALDGTNLFLGADNTFYVPTPVDFTLMALRGYFVVPEGTSASKMGINIDGETTSISTLNTADAINGKVYNLNGQYVGNDVKSLKKGVYVVNGRKFIVK